MQVYIQEGDTLDYTAPVGGVTSGGVIVGDGSIGVALGTVLEGETVSVLMRGVVKLPKAAGVVAWGDVLYWDADNEEVTTETEGGSPWGSFQQIGTAAKPELTGATTVNVKLLG